VALRSIGRLWERAGTRTTIAVVVVLLLPAAWQLGALARVIEARFWCPLDLDYLESAHVYHAWRIAERLPLYADPASGFATFPYPPLYWVALEGAASLFGFTDPAGRAVSIVSLLLTVGILAWQVARAAPSRLVGVVFAAIAVGGISAGYPTSDGSYDWARSDTMAMLLVVAAAAIARDGKMPPRRAWATGFVLALSIYTKQSGVVFAAWLVAFAFFRDRAGGLRLAAVSALFCVVPFAVLEVTTHGWFLVWLLYPSHQPLQPFWVAFGALGHFIWRAPFLPFLPWLAVRLSKRGWLRPTTVLWTGLFSVSVVGGAVASVKQFCCGNVWIPELLLAWPVAFMLAGDWFSGSPSHDAGPMPAAAAGVLALSSAVLVALGYDTSPFVPGTDRWQAAERLDGIARGLDGGVVVTTAPMVGVRAGGPVQQPILATYEDARSGGLRTDYMAALVASGARWVLTTDRYAGSDRAPELRLPQYFTRERTYDFDVHSLASWDRPKSVVLWRRAAR
jgi:hypothetical protein